MRPALALSLSILPGACQAEDGQPALDTPIAEMGRPARIKIVPE